MDGSVRNKQEYELHSNDDDTKPQPPTSNDDDEEPIRRQDQDKGMDDAAALMVMLYLGIISTLLVLTIIIGSFVVIKYGFVVLVACVCVVGALVIVGATLMSVITGDKKLTKARTTISDWHISVKDAILEEISNLHDDWSAYSAGALLLTYDGQFDEREEGAGTHADVQNETINNEYNATQQSQRKPKSLIFRYAVAPFTKLKRRGDSGDGGGNKKGRPWSRKKKQSADETSTSNYVPPLV
jgi:hypothetical protein